MPNAIWASGFSRNGAAGLRKKVVAAAIEPFTRFVKICRVSRTYFLRLCVQGKPMRDNNILTRFIKRVARKVSLGFVSWRCLRASYGTWLSAKAAI